MTTLWMKWVTKFVRVLLKYGLLSADLSHIQREVVAASIRVHEQNE